MTQRSISVSGMLVIMSISFHIYSQDAERTLLPLLLSFHDPQYMFVAGKQYAGNARH